MPKLSHSTIYFFVVILTVLIVGWAISTRLTTLQTTIQALSDSILRIKAPRLIPQEAILDTATSSTLLTADWHTYRNEQYGFEVKYPENWTFKRQFSNQEGFFIADSSSNAFIAVLPNGEFDYGIEEQPRVTNINFVGVEATQYKWPSEGIKWIKILQERLNWSKQDNRIDVHSDGQDKIIDQILSTFKFTR